LTNLAKPHKSSIEFFSIRIVEETSSDSCWVCDDILVSRNQF